MIRINTRSCYQWWLCWCKKNNIKSFW